MNPSTDAPAAATPNRRVAARLGRAIGLRRDGAAREATTELEAALAEARSTPYDVEFQTRVTVAMQLADLLLQADAVTEARAMLAEELLFTDEINRAIRANGTPAEKRAAFTGHIQVRDRAAQVGLLGRQGPEIAVADWVLGAPATLAELRGRVVLLEFWATWCKPCLDVFPVLQGLHEEYADRGLTVLALTRYAPAGGPDGRDRERELIRSVVADRGLAFSVGVSEDDRTQRIYGATGVPTVVLIDRHGLVRDAHFGGEQARLRAILERCLAEPGGETV